MFFIPALVVFALGACAAAGKNEAPVAASPSNMEVLRSLAPAEGPRFTPLFAQPVSDPAQRMQRLEEAVQALRNDLDTVAPVVAQMAVAARDHQLASGEVMMEGEAPPLDLKSAPSSAPALPAAAAAAPAAAQNAAPAVPVSPPPLPSLGVVEGVRIGDHPGKTRIVLDMTAPAGKEARLENNGKMLVVPLPRMRWAAKTSWEAESAQLVSGYRLEQDLLRLDLMYAAQIEMTDILPPTAANRFYRLVIDLRSPELHRQ